MISARINRACRSSGRANVHALLTGVNYSDENDGRGLISRLSSRSWTRGYDLGKLHFSFFRAFSFFFFFFFSASALSGPRCPITAAGGTWRRLFSSYRVARSVSPRLRDRNPSIYLIDLAGRVWCVESQPFVRRVVSWGSRKSGDAPRDACARTRLAFT